MRSTPPALLTHSFAAIAIQPLMKSSELSTRTGVSKRWALTRGIKAIGGKVGLGKGGSSYDDILGLLDRSEELGKNAPFAKRLEILESLDGRITAWSGSDSRKTKQPGDDKKSAALQDLRGQVSEERQEIEKRRTGARSNWGKLAAAVNQEGFTQDARLVNNARDILLKYGADPETMQLPAEKWWELEKMEPDKAKKLREDQDNANREIEGMQKQQSIDRGEGAGETATKFGTTIARRYNAQQVITTDVSRYADPKAHLANFENKGHAFVPELFHNRAMTSKGAEVEQGKVGAGESGFGGWGRGDGNFVSKLSEADQVVAAAGQTPKEQGGGIAYLERTLGIGRGDWRKTSPPPNNAVYRYKILNAEKLKIRMATGKEGGAFQEEWMAGGQTLGGADEAVVDRVEIGDIKRLDEEGVLKIEAAKFPNTPTVAEEDEAAKQQEAGGNKQ